MADYDNRKDAWEGEASNQLDVYLKMDEDALLAIAASGNRDGFYTLRSALKQKGTKKSVPVLIEILRKLDHKELFLERYHICETLFHLLHIKDKQLFDDIVGYLKGVDKQKKNMSLDLLQSKYSSVS